MRRRTVRGGGPVGTGRGWRGDEPPFRTPACAVTHCKRPSFTLSDTTFHSVDGPSAALLEQAR